jgi:hypothetical protein
MVPGPIDGIAVVDLSVRVWAADLVLDWRANQNEAKNAYAIEITI